MNLELKWSKTGLLDDIDSISKRKLSAEKFEEFGNYILRYNEIHEELINSDFVPLYFKILKHHLSLYNSVNTPNLVEKVRQYYNKFYPIIFEITDSNDEFAIEELFNLYIKYQQ